MAASQSLRGGRAGTLGNKPGHPLFVDTRAIVMARQVYTAAAA